MREFKFRAWQYLHNSYAKQSMVRPAIQAVLEGCDVSDSFVIEQYTGLKDKNGVEIYEGDIVAGDDGYNDHVVYEENKFIIQPLGDDCIYWEKLEVIGNIHENPELMDGGHDE